MKVDPKRFSLDVLMRVIIEATGGAHQVGSNLQAAIPDR